jgi:nucleolar GTP-binding protein
LFILPFLFSWQVIDTPGLLDHPLEERNTIEMQSITALAHLHAAVVYIIDISEQCGYTIDQQVQLFNSIKPLFVNKPILLVANKIDTVKFEELSETNRALLDQVGREAGAPGLLMSTATGEGVSEVKIAACERLLEKRVEIKMRGKRMVEVRNRLEVTLPKPRDSKKRPAFIPEAVLQAQQEKEEKESKKMEKEEEDFEEMEEVDSKPKSIFTGTHQYSRNWTEMEPYDRDKDPLFLFGPEWKEKYMLKEDEWKWDKIPEIMDGKNVADFYDEDIEEMLELLEKEEDERIRQLESAIDDGAEVDDLTEEDKIALAEWKSKKGLIKQEHEAKRTSRSHLSRKHTAAINSDVAEFESHLENIGIDPSAAVARLRSQSRGRSKSRGRESESDQANREELASAGKKRQRSSTPVPGISDDRLQRQAVKRARHSQKEMNFQARAGESDRRVMTKMPKHLFSGKRSISKTDRR